MIIPLLESASPVCGNRLEDRPAFEEWVVSLFEDSDTYCAGDFGSVAFLDKTTCLFLERPLVDLPVSWVT